MAIPTCHLSDNEPAILKLLTEAMTELRIQARQAPVIQQEHPTSYDKQSNGEVESAVKTFTGEFRTLKLCLERSLGVAVPATHPLLQWLAEWAAWQVTTRRVGDDCLTAYQRARGKEYAKRMVRFGERVLYQLPKGGSGAADGAIAGRVCRHLWTWESLAT